MQKGSSKTEALLVAILVIVLIWMVWYYYLYGTINLAHLFGF